jgi:hypothetical protein
MIQQARLRDPTDQTGDAGKGPAMNNPTPRLTRCAVYTRKSTEHNLDLAFTSLDAQRDACEAYIRSQAGEGWRLLPDHYDDGGLSGASLDRQPRCPCAWRPRSCRAPARQ